MCFIVPMTTSSLVLLISKIILKYKLIEQCIHQYIAAQLTTEKPPDHLGITNMLCF